MQETDVRERARTAPHGIVAALGELAGAGLQLAHNTVQLAACEARVVIRRLALRAGLLLGGIMFAVLGLLLLLGGGALLLAQASAIPTWLAVVIVGCGALGVGVLVAARMLQRLGDPDLAFPGTLAEFRADVDALRRTSGRSRAGTDDGET